MIKIAEADFDDYYNSEANGAEHIPVHYGLIEIKTLRTLDNLKIFNTNVQKHFFILSASRQNQIQNSQRINSFLLFTFGLNLSYDCLWLGPPWLNYAFSLALTIYES